MVAPVSERQRVVVEFEQVGHAADALKLSRAAQIVRKRNGVDRQRLVKHVMHRRVDGAIGMQVEVTLVELDERFLQHVLREQHG